MLIERYFYFWHISETGDAVGIDEVVGEIETDKTALPIVSPAAGVIEELLVEDGASVKNGDQLFKLKLGGAPAAADDKQTQEPAVESAPPTSPAQPTPGKFLYQL